ncbi:MAG: class I SAM-dependent methyltransferase [Anaerolineales bacterium]|nr:class I SAM-dependent methyltransferase [Anaerolineales bacterium]
MSTPLDKKSSVQAIQKRFDNDVERFSNLTTGQTATIDAPLAMELITETAVAVTNPIKRILDIGCGAGNNTLKLLELVGSAECHLLDLSLPMLEKAYSRVIATGNQAIKLFHGDFRTVDLATVSYDVVIAAAVLHHLRDDRDWETAFAKLYAITAPGGSVWITDLIAHENPAVQALMWRRYSDYLISVGGSEYRDKVFTYIDLEDSPRPLTYQLDLLRQVGFKQVDILHKNSCFAAFGAIK